MHGYSAGRNKFGFARVSVAHRQMIKPLRQVEKSKENS